MIKKLTKHGNSYAIVLSKALLKTLHVDENTSFTIESDGKQIIIKPKPAAQKKQRAPQEASMKVSQDKKMQKIYEKLAKQYKPALKKLSKN